MFIHAGALMTSKTPNQIIGVIAHESGHITGGHLARLRDQIAKAKSAALMLQLFALRAMVAGTAGGSNFGSWHGRSYGGSDVATRIVLSYRRDEESSADQAAVTFLNAAKQSARGLLEIFEFMNSKSLACKASTPICSPTPFLRSASRSFVISPRQVPITRSRTRLSCNSGTLGQGQAVRVPQRAADGVQSLPSSRSDPGCALCQGHRHLSQIRRAGRHAAARCADRR